MPFNNEKNGFQIENDFVNKLHNKRVSELDYNMRLFIDDFFENIKNDDIIFCYKNALLQKTDIFITINSLTKRISIKKGVKTSVHTEPISEFVHFLIENKIPRNLLIEF